jgi:uncharacterized membrane protein
MNTRKIAVIAVLVALAVGTNYAMTPLFNVKLMDVIVFIGGICFGPVVGALIGVISWAVYGTLNPYGFFLPIWFATMLSESIYGVVGGLIKTSLNEYRSGAKNPPETLYVFFGTLGVLLTLIYDVITNIVFGYVSNWSILLAVIAGFVPFGIAHVVSNAFFFGLGCVPAIKALSNIIGVDKSGIPEE